jgi:CBS domain containing-hemolysin-like protein
VEGIPLHEAVFINVTATVAEAIKLIQSTGFDQFPVKNEQGKTVGVLTDKALMARLAKNQVKLTDPIKKCVVRDIRQVSLGVTLNELSRVLVRNSFVLVEDKYFVTIADILALHTRSESKKKEAIIQETIATSPKAARINAKWITAGAMASIAGAAAFVLMKNK